MENNNKGWYNTQSDSGWYTPNEGSNPAGNISYTYKAPEKKKRKTSRIVGLVILLAVILAAAGFAVHTAKNVKDNVVTHFYWDDNGNEGSWSSDGNDFSEMPDNKEDFFKNYYQSVTTDAADVNIPECEEKYDFSLELQAPDTDELSSQEIYQNCAPSITAIYGYMDGKEGYVWGTGVVLSEDGLILTNTHVVEGTDKATVKLYDDSEYEATLVGADAISDIAVLKIDATGLKPASFGLSSDLSVGDKVIAIGNPLGESFRFTMTDGIISAIDRGINYNGHSMTLLQTNAALNSGNSGGALINMYGQVIGVTNMKMMSNYSSIEGIGFAIPSSNVKNVVDALIKDGAVLGRPSIGITVGAIPESAKKEYNLPDGLYVSQVQENSDAAKKGIKEGDVIIKVNYEPVNSIDQVNDIKNSLEVGDVMIFTVWRDGKESEIEVVLLDTNSLYQ